MYVELMNNIRELVIAEFKFLEEHGYLFVQDKIEEKMLLYTLQVVYLNKIKKKEITISSSVNLDLKNEFFITSSIVNLPYKTVNDFVSFDVYLRKDKNIITDTTVFFEDGEINLKLIRDSISSYAKLFKTYGARLIDSREQFLGYYP